MHIGIGNVQSVLVNASPAGSSSRRSQLVLETYVVLTPILLILLFNVSEIQSIWCTGSATISIGYWSRVLAGTILVAKLEQAFTHKGSDDAAIQVNFAHGRGTGIYAVQTVLQQCQATGL